MICNIQYFSTEKVQKIYSWQGMVSLINCSIGMEEDVNTSVIHIYSIYIHILIYISVQVCERQIPQRIMGRRKKFLQEGESCLRQTVCAQHLLSRSVVYAQLVLEINTRKGVINCISKAAIMTKTSTFIRILNDTLSRAEYKEGG